jgi:hypothetical protein
VANNYAKHNYPMDTCKPKTTTTGYKKPSYSNNQGSLGHRHTAPSKAPKNYKG